MYDTFIQFQTSVSARQGLCDTGSRKRSSAYGLKSGQEMADYGRIA